MLNPRNKKRERGFLIHALKVLMQRLFVIHDTVQVMVCSRWKKKHSKQIPSQYTVQIKCVAGSNRKHSRLIPNFPKLYIVQVKCVAGGNRKHSRLIPGEVCSLKLTHRKMATQLDKPRYFQDFLKMEKFKHCTAV